MTHTPGPWQTNDYGNDYAPSVYREGFVGGVICNTRSKHRSVAECKANARLIAAAPDMLECLRTWVELDNDGELPSREQINKVFDVIAKATGENVDA